LRGVYRSDFEVGAFHLCDTVRQLCASTLKVEDGCWLVFTETSAEQVDRLEPNLFKPDEFGEAWVEGDGRVAREPGSFGHLNQYPCQVELTTVRKVDPKPPFVFPNPYR
jgi:hypothetical protein